MSDLNQILETTGAAHARLTLVGGAVTEASGSGGGLVAAVEAQGVAGLVEWLSVGECSRSLMAM